MQRRMKTIAAMSACWMLLAGCGQAESKPDQPDQPAVTVRQNDAADLDPRIADASNAFGLRLFAALSEAEDGRNLWLSPLSVSSALAVAFNGAAGSTAEAMAGTLGLSALQREDVGSSYRMLLHLLNDPADANIKLSVANSLWLRKGYKFTDDYIDESVQNFGAEVQSVDFDKKKAALQTMNGWVKEHTNGKIPMIVDDIDSNARLFILNAVAFQGPWMEPFRKTDDAKFRVSPEKSVTVPMIAAGGRFEYADEPDYEALRIPIGRNGDDTFVILQPKPDASLQALRKQVAAEPELLARRYDTRSGLVELPKFRIDYAAELSDALKSLGMGEAFDSSRASFARIMPEPPNLFIGEVKHKTYLSVDENGIEAAAATEIGMEAGAAQPSDPFRMTVNRPFIAAIIDNETNALLFVGTIFDPE